MSTNIIRRRGDRNPYVIQVVDKKTGEPIDITGFTFLLAVDPSNEPSNSSNNIMQMDGVITDAIGGTVKFTPTVEEANNFGDFFYDIQMTDAGSLPRTIEHGKFILKQDISK